MYFFEKMWQRTSGWNATYLSPTEKDRMILARANAMLLFEVSCFKIPEQVISQITTYQQGLGGRRSFNSSRVIFYIA